MGQSEFSSARDNTCRLHLVMGFNKVVVFLVFISLTNSRRQLRGDFGRREERSLVGTFPFNQNDHREHQGNHHEEHNGNHHDHEEVDQRVSRQGDDGVDVSFTAVSGASPGSDGKKCIDKVEMGEETEYDDVEQCEENYRKSCFIEYETIAFNETVQLCRTPLVKDCDIQGPEVCRTEYESECWTKQEVHDVEDDVVACETVVEEKCEDETSGYTTNTKCSKWPKEVCSVSKKPVKKYTPVTACTKEPKELCAPAGCGFKEGAEECFDKTQTVVQDATKEQCSLEPQRTCKHVTKLVPKLEPTEECVDVPKEVCTRSRSNPRKVKKPVVKKWCYVPSEESGLAQVERLLKTELHTMDN